jgi:hypothetical protein
VIKPLKEKPSFLKLLVSIFIDILGSASYILDFFGFFVVGEITDLIFAPISATLVYLLYGNKTLAWINGIEEILPYTDFIPTATMGWFYERFK